MKPAFFSSSPPSLFSVPMRLKSNAIIHQQYSLSHHVFEMVCYIIYKSYYFLIIYERLTKENKYY